MTRAARSLVVFGNYLNLGAVSVELTATDVHEITEAASKIPVRGARLPEDVLKLSNR